MSAPTAPVAPPEKQGQITSEPAVAPQVASSQATPSSAAEHPHADTPSRTPANNDAAAAATSTEPPSYQDVTTPRVGGDIEPAPPNNVVANSNNLGVGLTQQQHAPVMVTPLAALTQAPTMIDCPWCHRQAMTTTQKEGTPMQIVAGALLCLVCICLAPLPCIAGWCEDVHIMCSACRKRVATLPDGHGPIQLHLPPNMVQVPSQYQGHPPPIYGQAQVPLQELAPPQPAKGQGVMPSQQQQQQQQTMQ